MHDDSTATGPHDERKQHDDAERRARLGRLYALLYRWGAELDAGRSERLVDERPPTPRG